MKKFYYWCVALSVPIITLVTLLSCFSVDVPLIDDYDAVLRYLVQPFPERLLHLADFNSEHRIFTARIVFECIYQALGHFDFRACMTIGAIFLLGYGILFYYLLPFDASDGACSRLERWYFVPAIWLVVSVLNNDNICWAMTSIRQTKKRLLYCNWNCVCSSSNFFNRVWNGSMGCACFLVDS